MLPIRADLIRLSIQRAADRAACPPGYLVGRFSSAQTNLATGKRQEPCTLRTLPHDVLPRAVCFTALGAALVACGDDSDTGNSSPSDTQIAANGDVFNQADVEFAAGMIPHHAQAIQMVTFTDGRPLDPAVQQLANQIRDAQVSEVETMADWLTSWARKSRRPR